MKIKINAIVSLILLSVVPAMVFFLSAGAEAFEPWKNGHFVGNAAPGDESHQSITETAIKDFVSAHPEIFGTCPPLGTCPPSKAAMNQIVDANGKVDSHEPFTKAAHFDSESFIDGQARLTTKLREIKTRLDAGSISEARASLGQALHTLQDFYSHSNWVEDRGAEGNYQDLGRGGILPVASGATCDDCTGPPAFCGPSPCPGNVITTPPNWTSGYFAVIATPNTKPAGKCSHGGCFDGTSGFSPIGGINKDTSNSPHGTLHSLAATLAKDATKLFLTNLQDDAAITPEQVKKLLSGPTLAICIDTTGSMGPIIEEVKNDAIAIVNARLGTDEEPGQYVLAPFNDPAVPPPIVTSDPDVFKGAVSSLTAEGGDDCPELAGQGMLNAISAASPGGDLFLFTDADAKDPFLMNKAQDTANAKKIQTFFPIFGSCSFDAPTKASGRATVQAGARTNYPAGRSRTITNPGSSVASHGVDPIYQQVAQATGGQVFSLDESEAGQITTLLDSVSRTNAVNILSIQDSLGPAPSVYSVPIDDTVSAVTFSISGDTSVTLTRPDGSTVQDGDPGVTITNLSAAHLFSIANPATGDWQLSVSGNGAFSVTVTGEATLDIKTFEFVKDLGDQAHEPGLFPIDGFPIAGQPNMVSAELTDGFASAEFEFRSPAGTTLQHPNLEQGTGTANTVFVGSVTPPSSAFIAYATGMTAGGASFQRLVPGTIMAQSVTVTAPAPADVAPGTLISYTFQVQNLGSTDTFQIEGSDDKAFLVSITPTNVSLATGETKDVTVVLQAPANAIIGTSDTLTVTATGGSGAHNFAVVVSDVVIASHLDNISTRSFVQTADDVMIGGFIVQGTIPKKVIIRAIGPELGAPPYNVPGVLADPILELHDGTGALIASNDDWHSTIIGGIITSTQWPDIANSGHAPTDGRESAIIADLPAGNYTAIVRGVSNTTGVALVEVYDLGPDTGPILSNISTRSFVQTGDNVMIGGLIVNGATPKKVIVRAIGPELGAPPYNVPNALANPTLELHDATGALIASNDNWRTTIIGGIITSDQVSDILNSSHAPTDGRESAIIADLAAGNYTAIVRGVDNMTGVALVEVYDLQ